METMESDIVLENFYARIAGIVESLEEFDTGHIQGHSGLPITHIVHKIDGLCRDVLQVHVSMPHVITDRFVTLVTSASRHLHKYSSEENGEFSYQAPITNIGLPGRPRYEITYSQFELLLEAEFTIKEIGKLTTGFSASPRPYSPVSEKSNGYPETSLQGGITIGVVAYRWKS